MTPLSPSDLSTPSAAQTTAVDTLTTTINNALQNQHDPGERAYAVTPPSQETSDPLVRELTAAGFLAAGWEIATWQTNSTPIIILVAPLV